LANSRRSTRLHLYPFGRVEQDPSEIWHAVRDVLRKCIGSSRVSVTDIAAVGVAGQTGGMILVDKAAKPITMISWRDNRANGLVEKWKKESKEESYYDITVRPSDSQKLKYAPPSIFIDWPVIQSDLSEARNRTNFETSSGRPTLPSGIARS